MNAILLIGSYLSGEVDSYDWWQDLPNISEYDTIIIDTTKLRRHWDGRLEHVEENTYTLLNDNDHDDRIRGNLCVIERKLLEKAEFDASIYVLYTPEISVYRPPRDPIHTESWRPLSFNPVLESGRIIDVVEPSYRAYFSGFGAYRFYFPPDSIDIARIQDYYVGKWAVTFRLKEIAINKVRKPLAFDLALRFHRYAADEEALRYEPNERPYESVVHHEGSHLVLLPVSDDYDSTPAIEDIIRISRQSEYIPPPPWVDTIQIPGESAALSEIKALEHQIEEIATAKEKLGESLAELRRHKRLLYETGTTLQETVRSTLERLGAEIEPSVATDEFIINVQGTRILAEVKGNTKSISKSDLAQLITDIGEHLKITGNDIDGILIGNAWRLLPIEERNTPDKPIFPDNVIKVAERRNIGLLSTIDLFLALCEALKDPSRKKDTLGKLLGSRQGVIKFL